MSYIFFVQQFIVQLYNYASTAHFHKIMPMLVRNYERCKSESALLGNANNRV